MEGMQMSAVDVMPPESGPGLGGLSRRDFAALAWRFRWLLVLAAVVGGGITFAMSIFGPRVYESTVTFAVTPSKIGDGGQTANTTMFRPMVESAATAASVIQELGLNRAPYHFRPSRLLGVVSVNEVRGT